MEVLSPDETSRDIDAKVADYLAAGVSEVVIVDPAATVTRQRPAQAPQVLRRGEDVDLDDVVPGFRCAVNDIFE